jgi:argininosuccinate synthase
VEIGFEKGTPVSIDNEHLGPVDLVKLANRIGGENAVGRIDLVENRLVGMKSRGTYETPGGTLLVQAHRELESICLDKETLRIKDQLALKYADLVYNGQWFTPLREALDAFVETTQENVTGGIRLKLYKGNVIVAGRKSPSSLYREDLATFGEEAVYNQKEAEGFINLFGLPVKVQALLKCKRI